MCRALPCVAIVAICLSLRDSSGRKVDDNQKKHYVHPKYRLQEVSSRIIGGEETPPHAYPFQVGLWSPVDNTGSACGGSLISPDKVLTAAHCLDHQPNYVDVYLGTHRLYKKEHGKSVVMTSRDYMIHWWWDPDTLQYDIALIELPRKVTFTKYIQPIQLASGSNTYTGKKGTIIGWGDTEKGPASVLKRVNVTVISNSECRDASSLFHTLIAPVHLCTSGAGIVGSCFGDSGGPLVVGGVQVGIVSFGPGECITGSPSVFTRVSEFEGWIAVGQKRHLAGANTLKGQFRAVALIALGSLYLS